MTYDTLFANQVEELLALKPVVLDHRDPRSYAEGHLPEALPVSDANISSLIRSKDRERPVLVYCYHGNSSRDLCKFIMQFGFKNVYNLEGGWQAWAAHANQLQSPISNELKHWLRMNGFDPANLNTRIQNGMTNLMLACLQGNHALVAELLQAEVDVDLVNDDRNNALWFACVSEDEQSIRLLLEKGIDIDNQNVNGATSLIYAASAGKFDVVRLLTQHNADLYKKTHDDFTALDSAASMPVLKHLKQCYSQQQAVTS